ESDLSDTVSPVVEMTATEAARTFSQLLNRVSAGEEIRVLRNGAEVAVIAPPAAQTVSAARFREVIATAPPVDDAFADELQDARAAVPAPASAWPS
ncbi:MAG TPA: type II toxin-antitoxin system prevent-host-death family antitoxin, partial [Solirubrobacteraceae bacterium]|nr:type II toxin-antitoxin system prevent-host-death family antitoxin [Solirubrobacteraceae bacterium]